MPVTTYRARVRESRVLELPEEAAILGLLPGEEVCISVDRSVNEASYNLAPNEIGLAAMREIASRQNSRADRVAADVVKLVREARSGAMYGHDDA